MKLYNLQRKHSRNEILNEHLAENNSKNVENAKNNKQYVKASDKWKKP